MIKMIKPEKSNRLYYVCWKNRDNGESGRFPLYYTYLDAVGWCNNFSDVFADYPEIVWFLKEYKLEDSKSDDKKFTGNQMGIKCQCYTTDTISISSDNTEHTFQDISLSKINDKGENKMINLDENATKEEVIVSHFQYMIDGIKSGSIQIKVIRGREIEDGVMEDTFVYSYDVDEVERQIEQDLQTLQKEKNNV